MAKALVVTYLIAFSIGLAAAYAKECAVGPEFWCKSFQNAEDCGAIRHCTDTVWTYDKKYALSDSSTTCQWCQRILENTYKGIQKLASNEASIIPTLAQGCELFPSNDFSSKCTNVINNYGTSVISLMKNKRYATLCRLMSMCSSESVIEKPTVIVGQKRCTWGPSYWCSSLSNSRECHSTAHCSSQIWSKQSIEKKKNDNICQYCEFIIGKLRSFINDNKTEINVEKWLSGACSMLQTKDAIDECVQSMSKYAEDILVLIKDNIDPGVICHLGHMCKEATIVVRVKAEDNQSTQKKILPMDDVEVKETPVDQQSRMLCNVIVRATYELHVNQQKSQNEIQKFLKNDCQKLSSSELIQKCEDLVNRRGNDIYGNVINNKELSEICDHPGNIVDSTSIQSVSHTQCELCTFVLATTKRMLDAKHSEDKVLLYIDEQLCSRLNGEIQKNCKYMIETNGKDFIDNIQRGTQSILLCTYFQVCLDEIITETSPVQKNEMRSFLKENICDHLGPFEDSCNALMEKDTTRLLGTLVNNMEGDILCQMFGICSMKMSFIDNLSINDDKNKCQRCLDDFTRRKHIAEKLLNYSAEFLHHFCGQLSQEDECIKTVDESINKLVEFIRSLNPQDICLELKMCNQALLKKIEPIRITSSDNIISQEIIIYIKNEICTKLGSLSNLCDTLMDSEAKNLFAVIAKNIDPHRVCSVLNVCSTTTAFENCNDKCECCVAKIENYQVQLASFLQTILTTITGVCERIPHSNECRGVAAEFKSKIDEIITRFNAKRICQSLTHCSSAPVACDINGDKCACCQNHLSFRQKNFRTIINEITTILLSSCTDNDCRSLIQSNQQKTLNQIDKINSLTLCQRFGFCSSSFPQRSIPFLSDLMTNTYQNLGLSDNLCSNFENLKPICEHLLTSRQSDRYVNVYMAILKNNSTFIDEDLQKLNSNTCDACKKSVQSSKDFWINALESVRNVLLQTCERCPSKDQCRDYVNQRFDNMKAYLDKINSEQFCQTIHLCSSISLTSACSTCVERLQVRKDGVLQAIDRLAGYFNDLCQRYAEKQCQVYVKHVHDTIQKSIEEFDAKETCSVIGFCTADGSENEMDFDQYEEYLGDEIEKNICSTLGPFEILCKEAIQGDTKQIQALKMNYDIKDLMHIGEELTENLSNTEDLDECSQDKCRCCIFRVIQRKNVTRFIGDHIFLALIRSCDYCPAKDQCRQHLRIAKARFDCHINKIQPKRVCTHLGFCNKTSIGDNMGSFQETIEPVVEIQHIDDSNSTCILCEYVMNILSNYIHRQSTEEEIEQSLQKVCNQIPSILKNQCHDYIDNYGPAIIATLLREFELSTICHKLNLCTNQMKIDIAHIIKADIATCGICDYISTYLHFVLKRDSNEKSLQHALSTVCSHLSNEQYPKCQTIVQLFSPHIRQLELSPGNNFCKQLTICQTPMMELKPAILLNKKDKDIITNSLKQSVVDQTLMKSVEKTPSIGENLSITPQCTLCHYVISYLDAVLKNNKSEQAFEEALEKVCTILPSKERTECNQFIKNYGPILAELIAESVDPDAVCRYLAMCQDSSTKKSTPVTDYVRVQTPYTCSICQFMVSRMKRFIGVNQGEHEVFASVKDSCDLYSVDSLKNQCKDFLDQHGSYFLQMISNDLIPRIACQSIGICGATYEKPTTTSLPVSSSIHYGKCIFGMKYWCTSRENAKLCNAVELCKREVWSKKNIVIN